MISIFAFFLIILSFIWSFDVIAQDNKIIDEEIYVNDMFIEIKNLGPKEDCPEGLIIFLFKDKGFTINASYCKNEYFPIKVLDNRFLTYDSDLLNSIAMMVDYLSYTYGISSRDLALSLVIAPLRNQELYLAIFSYYEKYYLVVVYNGTIKSSPIDHLNVEKFLSYFVSWPEMSQGLTTEIKGYLKSDISETSYIYITITSVSSEPGMSYGENREWKSSVIVITTSFILSIIVYIFIKKLLFHGL